MKPPVLLPIVVCLCVAAVASTTTQAAVLTVTNVDDSGPGSLRQAVLDAEPGDEVRFLEELDGQPILLTGRAIVIDKSLTITGRGPDSTLIDGGGSAEVFTIIRQGTTVHISELTIRNGRGRYGGGIHCGPGTGLTLTESAVIQNVARTSGGGIAAMRGAAVTISHSIVSGNAASGYGGGIYAQEATVALDNSTVAVNSARFGGGIYNWNAMVTLENSTITRNSDWHYAGGIYNKGGLATVQMRKSMVASQRAGGDCYGLGFTSLGHNLDSDGSCSLYRDSDLPETDPGLHPLADNGGPTCTCALQADSPAIDAAGLTCGPTDQRGRSRPKDGDADGINECDIGAFEYQPRVIVIGDLHNLIIVLLGEDHDLVDPLQAAIQVLEDGDPGNDPLAIAHLQSFIAEVEHQRGRTLSNTEADGLIAEARRVIQLLSFDGSPTATP